MHAWNYGETYDPMYANSVVCVKDLVRVENENEGDEGWPYLYQGDDFIQVSTYFWGDIAIPEKIASLTGIADYMVINANGLSIQPLNAESVVEGGASVNVEYAEIGNIYTENGLIVVEGEFQIFTITGQNVTAMNGNLAAGVYVVRTANAASKVVVK